jgi:cytochrome c biogenesis protein CcdA
MFRLIGICISIGLADSLNPTTIAPALYLAAGEHPKRRVTEFTLGVFGVYLIGGAAIALGPGQLLLSLVPHPGFKVRHILEIAAGTVLLSGSMLLWRHRHHLRERDPPAAASDSRSSALLGATITAVELPTAFPYFAAIAAIVGSGMGPARQLFLLVLFNVCFVAPLAAIAATLYFAGEGATDMLERARDRLQRHWPAVLATVGLIAGVFVIVLGATGLAARLHNRVGGFFRHVQHFLPGH